MKKIKLGDVCRVQSGYAFKSSEFKKNKIPIIRIGNIQENKVLIDNSICYTEDFFNNHPEFEINKGDILIAMSGATVGKIGNYLCESKALLNQRVGKFIITGELENRYLYFLLKSPLFEKFILNNAFGCAQPNISNKKIEEFEFYNYEVQEQIEIATKLDKIQTIIDIRKKQIKELDELIKSQFVEMFENKKFEQKSLNEISIIKGEYGSGASAGEYIEGQPRYVRITDIQEDGRLDNKSLASPKNEKNIEKYILKYGDLLFARTGATVGKTYKYNEKDGYCIYAGYCIRFRLNLEICNPEYIYIYTKTNNYKKWIENKQRVVAQPNINAKEYGNDLKIPIPPIALQNKFAEFVKQIDKQKFVKQTITELSKLKEILIAKHIIISSKNKYKLKDKNKE